ncbi:uncharacterized protein LOC113368178 [Ctenocephalides felis]|uniref:uncharacterized protein LOC113366436 n=1 Tax=Ctenocephalides felis TaxID=7515 RepID=UPI000E6E5288|nr:uncharacterized protein LOC113366436 [Ctenocephalides felis]XP_026465530.1 uncharacterized protein LOC113368178 [Ctenocephalides felis]
MIGVRAITKSSPVVRTLLQQTRNFNDAYPVVSGPPRTKISTAEKIVHGAVITVGCLAIPAWVLLHLQEYKGEQ